MNTGTEGMKKQAQELIDQAYQSGYKAGFDEGVLHHNINIIDKWIEQGRNEAWDAAEKLVSMGYKECNKVLGDGVLTIETIDDIFVRCTASEAIKKIREYEQKKQKETEEIHVGDEVVRTDNNSKIGVVTRIVSDAMWLIFPDGLQICANNLKYWKKTGRTFPQISEVLEKMKEDEEA